MVHCVFAMKLNKLSTNRNTSPKTSGLKSDYFGQFMTTFKRECLRKETSYRQTEMSFESTKSSLLPVKI